MSDGLMLPVGQDFVIEQLTAETKRRAALYVCGRAADANDASHLLAALGLAVGELRHADDTPRVSRSQDGCPGDTPAVPSRGLEA